MSLFWMGPFGSCSSAGFGCGVPWMGGICTAQILSSRQHRGTRLC